jgi:hypothetical protein
VFQKSREGSESPQSLTLKMLALLYQKWYTPYEQTRSEAAASTFLPF